MNPFSQLANHPRVHTHPFMIVSCHSRPFLPLGGKKNENRKRIVQIDRSFDGFKPCLFTFKMVGDVPHTCLEGGGLEIVMSIYSETASTFVHCRSSNHPERNFHNDFLIIFGFSKNVVHFGLVRFISEVNNPLYLFEKISSQNVVLRITGRRIPTQLTRM